MMLFLILIFLALLAFHIKTRYGRNGRLYSKIPGPYALPIIGNMLMFNMSCLHEFWKVGHKANKEYYPMTRFWLCSRPLISSFHPDDVEVLLTSSKAIDKGYGYHYLHPWLRRGLLTSAGGKWHQRRKILTPAFHFGILKKYVEIASEQGEKFVRVLKAEGEESVKSLVPLCSDYTLNIICESTMGVALDNVDQTEVRKYKKAVHDFGEIVLYRVPRPYIPTWMMDFIPKFGSMQRKALKVLHGFTEKVVDERKEYHRSLDDKLLDFHTDNVDEAVHEDIVIGRKKRMAMLDLLLASEKNGLIDREGILEEVDTFTFEGHDTAATAMTYTLLLLAENKDAQELARAEVTALLDKTNGKLGITELQDLNYLERCIKESLRLYPPVGYIVRYTAEDIQLKHALIPKGSDIIVHFWETHRDPEFWPNPEKYDPDRFLPERSANRHPFSYVPFSAGPRNCIGQKFAMMELKSLIARILYDFHLEPIDRTTDLRLTADIILRSLDPVRVKFIKINKK